MKSDEKYLKHILQVTGLIEIFIEGITKTEFKHDPEKQFAVVRGLEIIGEAVKNISTQTKRKNPSTA